MVVFYDGFNDLTLQIHFGVHEEPTHLFFGIPAEEPVADESAAATVSSWWADHSAVALAASRVADLFDDEPTVQVADIDAVPIDTIDPVAAADAALKIHRQGVDHVLSLARGYDFETLFFWQPYLYTKSNLTPAEQNLVGLPGYDTDVWLPMTERVPRRPCSTHHRFERSARLSSVIGLLGLRSHKRTRSSDHRRCHRRTPPPSPQPTGLEAEVHVKTGQGLNYIHSLMPELVDTGGFQIAAKITWLTSEDHSLGARLTQRQCCADASKRINGIR